MFNLSNFSASARSLRLRFSSSVKHRLHRITLVSSTFKNLQKLLLAVILIQSHILSSSPVLAAGLDYLPVPESALASPVVIKALNPGYELDDQSNVGEFIELAKNSDQPSISLAGFSLSYTNTSGKRSSIIEFPEDSQMTGETLLFRYAKSPASDAADWAYTTTLAMEAGPLELLYRGEVVDSVCWRGKSCLTKFDKVKPTSIVKDFEEQIYTHQEDYEPDYDPESQNYLGSTPTGVIAKTTAETPSTDDATKLPPQCNGLIFNELLSYYENDKTEQFIEFFNPTDETINLEGCEIKYKKKIYPLSGVISAGDYITRSTADFTLTKNPTTSNTIELLDINNEVIDKLEYPNGQKKSASYALFGYTEKGTGQWQITYAPTPGATNSYQEYRSCPAGKVINVATGNCVKATTVNTTKAECPAGKYRNPETGRCKKIEDNSPKVCAEGYELNPETNRCRKIKNNTGADFALVPITGEETTNFVAISAVITLIATGLIYLVFQFRHEIRNLFRKLLGKPKLPVSPGSSNSLRKAWMKTTTYLRLHLQRVRHRLQTWFHRQP